MTSLVSIRIDSKLLLTMKANAHLLEVSQTDYIRRAIELMNKKIEKEEKSKQLQAASLRVRGESMKINAEFGEFEDDPEA